MMNSKKETLELIQQLKWFPKTKNSCNSV